GHYLLSVDAAGKTYQLALDDGTTVERGTVGDSVGRSVGFAWTPKASLLPAKSQTDFVVTAPYDAAQQLGKDIQTRVDPGGSFLRIELRGTNPALTTATVNEIAERVVNVAAELKRRKYNELAKILGGQYDHAQRALSAAEVALKDFRVRNVN